VSCWQFVPGIWRHVGDAAQYSIHESGIGSTATFLKILDRQQRRRLFRNGGGDELIDGNVVLLGKLADFTMQGIGKPETQVAHVSSSMDARKAPGVMIYGMRLNS
jgi:hypothetical protein